MAPLPLDGLLVVDLGQIYAGPYATFLMAMAGADVVKVEPPGGENLRGRSAPGFLPFSLLNRNKRAITLNLKSPRGRELLVALAGRADVLVENYAPGVLDRLGCGWEVLSRANPRLVYGSCTGYGLDGPKRDLLAMDLTIQAMGGVLSVTGFPDGPPVKAGPAVCDFSAGAHLYAGIVTALLERARTGRGRLVEVSMLEATLPMLSSSLALWLSGGRTAPPRTGNHHSTLAEAPYNVYPTRDGAVAVMGIRESHWEALCAAMGRPELAQDPRFATRTARVENIEALDAAVSAWSGGLSRDEAVGRLVAHGVPHAPVRDLAEVLDDPHLHERGSLAWVEDPGMGRVPALDSSIRYRGSERVPYEPSPGLGRDTAEVLTGLLGLEAEEIDRLRADGVL